MNRLKRKLTSQTGASITYALLLFLVCAVVSSVVLAAGTAASGRISKSVESDQRYYSVTSAAEFLKNQLDGGTCVFTTVTDGSTSTTTTTAAETDLLTDLSKVALDVKKTSVAGNKQYVLTTTSTDGDLNVTIDAAVTIDSSMGDDPILTMKVYNTNNTNGTFSIVLTFTSSIESRSGKSTTSSSSTTVDKVVWNYYSIKT